MKGLNFTCHFSLLDVSSEEEENQSKKKFSFLGGLYNRITGNKVLTKEDLAPVLAALREQLMVADLFFKSRLFS